MTASPSEQPAELSLLNCTVHLHPRDTDCSLAFISFPKLLPRQYLQSEVTGDQTEPHS